jgi:hypothetical protein
MRHILWVTAWVAAFGRFAPVAAAPGDTVATVTVHGRHNCLEVDTREVGAPIRLEPGMYDISLRPDSPGIAYGASSTYERRRARNVLLDFDNTQVSVLWHLDAALETARPAAIAGLAIPDGHFPHSNIGVYVKKPTVVYAYVIDRNPADNAGSVVLRISGKSRAGDTVERLVTVDGRRHCVKADLKNVARRVELARGEYTVELGEGAIIYGTGAGHRERAARNVLLDFDPAAVNLTDVECGEEPGDVYVGEPLAAYGLNPVRPAIRLHVLRKTTVHFYVIDYHAAGNSGSVKVRVEEGLGGI